MCCKLFAVTLPSNERQRCFQMVCTTELRLKTFQAILQMIYINSSKVHQLLKTFNQLNISVLIDAVPKFCLKSNTHNVNATLSTKRKSRLGRQQNFGEMQRFFTLKIVAEHYRIQINYILSNILDDVRQIQQGSKKQINA